MIGVITKNEENVNEWLEPLSYQSKYGKKSPHNHGYGVAYYENGQLHTRRELAPIWERKTDFTNDSGTIIILHSRQASKGSINLNNVHPFTATVDEGSFVFCHNGTIHDIDKLKVSRVLEGEEISDSRILFEHFQMHFELTGDFIESIKTTIDETASKCSRIASMNSLFSDGKSLVAVRYCLEEEDYFSLGYTPLKEPKKGFAITTQKYDDINKWTWMKNKTINVFTPDSVESFEL